MMKGPMFYESPEMSVIRLGAQEDVIRTSNPTTDEDNDVYQDDFFD